MIFLVEIEEIERVFFVTHPRLVELNILLILVKTIANKKLTFIDYVFTKNLAEVSIVPLLMGEQLRGLLTSFI
jgi:hypothetical protein